MNFRNLIALILVPSLAAEPALTAAMSTEHRAASLVSLGARDSVLGADVGFASQALALHFVFQRNVVHFPPARHDLTLQIENALLTDTPQVASEISAIGQGSALLEAGRIKLEPLSPQEQSDVGMGIKYLTDLADNPSPELSRSNRDLLKQVVERLKGIVSKGVPAFGTFKAVVRSREDYLVAFTGIGRMGLAREALDLFKGEPALMGKLLFHETCANLRPERNKFDHQERYQGYEREIFGEDNFREDIVLIVDVPGYSLAWEKGELKGRAAYFRDEIEKILKADSLTSPYAHFVADSLPRLSANSLQPKAKGALQRAVDWRALDPTLMQVIADRRDLSTPQQYQLRDDIRALIRGHLEKGRSPNDTAVFLMWLVPAEVVSVMQNNAQVPGDLMVKIVLKHEDFISWIYRTQKTISQADKRQASIEQLWRRAVEKGPDSIPKPAKEPDRPPKVEPTPVLPTREDAAASMTEQTPLLDIPGVTRTAITAAYHLLPHVSPEGVKLPPSELMGLKPRELSLYMNGINKVLREILAAAARPPEAAIGEIPAEILGPAKTLLAQGITGIKFEQSGRLPELHMIRGDLPKPPRESVVEESHQEVIETAANVDRGAALDTPEETVPMVRPASLRLPAEDTIDASESHIQLNAYVNSSGNAKAAFQRVGELAGLSPIILESFADGERTLPSSMLHRIHDALKRLARERAQAEAAELLQESIAALAASVRTEQNTVDRLRRLHHFRTNLTPADVLRLSKDLAAGDFGSRYSKEWLFYLFYQRERPWTDMTPETRQQITAALQEAHEAGHLSDDLYALFLFPIWTPILLQEGHEIPANLAKLWSNDTDEHKIQYIRLGADRVRQNKGKLLVELKEVSEILNIDLRQLTHFLKRSPLPILGLGLMTFRLSPEELQAATWLAKDSPEDILFASDAGKVIGRNATELRSWASHRHQQVSYLLDEFELLPDDSWAEAVIGDHDKPSPLEKRVISTFIHLLAHGKPLNKLIEKDLLTDIEYRDHKLPMSTLLARMNDLAPPDGWNTIYFMLQRYELLAPIPELSDIAGPSELRSFSQAAAALRGGALKNIPWRILYRTDPNIIGEAVRKLGEWTGKPGIGTLWLQVTKEYALSLEFLGGQSLLGLIRWAEQEWEGDTTPDKPKTIPFYLAKLAGYEIGSMEDVNEAIHKGWIAKIPWQTLPDRLSRSS